MNEKDKPQKDSDLFKSFVADITPISNDKVTPHSNQTKARVKKNTQHPVYEEARSAHKTAHQTDSFFAHSLAQKFHSQLRQGEFECQASLDLHGCSVEYAEQQLQQFINDCVYQNIRSAIIVHGQGHHSSHGSILKPAILYSLSRYEVIQAYCPAIARDGGHGASYILIKT